MFEMMVVMMVIVGYGVVVMVIVGYGVMMVIVGYGVMMVIVAVSLLFVDRSNPPSSINLAHLNRRIPFRRWLCPLLSSTCPCFSIWSGRWKACRRRSSR